MFLSRFALFPVMYTCEKSHDKHGELARGEVSTNFLIQMTFNSDIPSSGAIKKRKSRVSVAELARVVGRARAKACGERRGAPGVAEAALAAQYEHE